MADLDYDLGKTLDWCAKNLVSFQITNTGDVKTVVAQLDNIATQYIIPENTPAALGNAVWAALFAVKHGTEFHAKYGQHPPVSSGPDPDLSRDSVPER